MSESKPRDLTAEELALTQAPAVRGGSESSPLRTPPGSRIPIELWNPTADAAALERGDAAHAAPSGAPPGSR